MMSPAPAAMRSAAMAIASSPDAQNRLIVAAEAETGTPARRLAMRATLRPCSASGIAQPKTTSSTSSGAMLGTRRSASRITAAASSSGRVVRSVPFGALPTAVRTAETITAWRMVVDSSIVRRKRRLSLEIPEQVLERFADFLRLAFEQVSGAVDDRQLFGFLQARVERAQVLERTEIVEVALDEKFRRRRFERFGERIVRTPRRFFSRRSAGGRRDARYGWRDCDEGRDARVVGAGFERNPGAERESGRPQRRIGIFRVEKI